LFSFSRLITALGFVYAEIGWRRKMKQKKIDTVNTYVDDDLNRCHPICPCANRQAAAGGNRKIRA
jgi:hypothetical protein